MRRRHIIRVVVAFILLLALSALIGNLVGRGSGIDLSGNDPVVLNPATKDVLGKIKGRVTLTYFVSSKNRMPATMKDVEVTVRRLLQALKEEAPDTIDVSVIDPDIDSQYGAGYASRKAIAPIKLRAIRFDASSEQAVWSALDIAFNDYPNAVIPFVDSTDLPYLQDLIASNLKMMAQPAAAFVGVSAPAQGYTQLPKVLSTIPLLSPVKVDFESTAFLPPALDMFMWIEPRRIEARHLRALERFVDAGRSVVIVGSEHTVTCSNSAGTTSCRLERSPYDFRGLAQTFGLGVRSELVVDAPSQNAGGSVPFPIHFPARLTDIRALHGFTIGELHVASVSALEPDPDLLNQSGFEAEIIATTSADTRLISEPKGVFGQEALRRTNAVPKQPWIVRLNPKDPWRGSVLVIGAASVFSDPFLSSSDNSNNLLLKAAAETFTSRDKLARLRIERRLPQPVPEVSATLRVTWRVVVAGAIPLVLLAFALVRERSRFRLPQGSQWGSSAERAVVAFVGIVLVSAFVETRPLIPVDLTGSAPMTRSSAVTEILARIPGGVEADLIISGDEAWPAVFKGTEIEIRAALRSAGIRYEVYHPERLSPDDRQRLLESGIEPFTIERIEGDETIRSQVWSAVRVRTKTLSTSIPAIEPRMLKDMQFLLGAALLRLERGGPGPTIGLVSDIPRLTGAQAFEEYTQMGYTAPEGSNPFGEVERLLTRYGYQVRAINPNTPDFRGKLDLVVWLQPRAPVELLPDFGNYLASGGKAFVALQQYKVKQRQYRGRGYDTVYWPEPQTHRFNEYLKLIGISQTGEKSGGPAEILMDENQGRLALDTRVYQRSRYREMLKQEVVRPFLIRAIGAGLSASSPITAHLGALLYVWGNRFTVDNAKLSELGLRATSLAQTSAKPWRFIWDGGWIPEPALSSPTPNQFIEGPLPLALEVRGHFPKVALGATADRGGFVLDAREPAAPKGELILSASSEMFTDSNIYLEGYQHDRFLLNGVAALAFSPEVAALQARPLYPQAFPVQTRAFKLSWRLIVIAAAPLILIVCGVWYNRRRFVVGGA